MNLWHDVSIGKPPETINVIVEIPKGSQNKYEYDKENNIFRLDRVLFSPLHYPGDYGIIPRTLGEDGDPLDALVLVTSPNYPGTLVESRPLGILKMTDSGKKDSKILCVPKRDERFSGISDIKDLQKHTLKEIAHFFQVYKELEGKKVKIRGWSGTNEARKTILIAIELYNKKFNKKEDKKPR